MLNLPEFHCVADIDSAARDARRLRKIAMLLDMIDKLAGQLDYSLSAVKNEIQYALIDPKGTAEREAETLEERIAEFESAA